MTFEPKIVGFLCNWCSYAGADLAGVSRISYPPNIRIIRLMCSGRVDPVIVLETLAQGADGVLVMGCHIGDCHYITGNLQAERKINMLEKILARTGLEAERLRLEWVSASEGGRFAQLVKDFTDQLKKLGPSPLAGDKPDKNILASVSAAKAAAEDFRLRLFVGREKTMIDDGNVYGEEVSEEELDKVLDEIIDTEYVRNRIFLLVKKEPLSVKELSKRLDLDSQMVLRHIVVMKQRGLITIDRVKGTSPLYTALEVGR
jgi:F420-non-reducing hydrogenase iron-sulfur subunit